MPAKPGLTAWERWELASFDSVAPADAAVAEVRVETLPEVPTEDASAVPQRLTFSEEELSALKDAAYQEAFAEGRKAGYDEGYERGKSEGEAAGRRESEALGKVQVEQLTELVQQLDSQIKGLDAAVADELLNLALEVARKVVAHTVATQPESVVDVVHEALAQLPIQHASIHLHPEDASLARLYAGDTLAHLGHRLHENPKLQRGDVVIDVGGSHLDATLATRWRRVLDTIGKSMPLVAEPIIEERVVDKDKGIETQPAQAAETVKEKGVNKHSAEPADEANE